MLLAQGIARDQLFGAANGLGPAALLLVLPGELPQRVGMQPGEPLALGGQPVVVAVLQQVAAVEPDRLGGPPLRHGPFELLDVQP
jgi:hypothetical protein